MTYSLRKLYLVCNLSQRAENPQVKRSEIEALKKANDNQEVLLEAYKNEIKQKDDEIAKLKLELTIEATKVL